MTGKLSLAGKNYSFSSRFTADGLISNTIPQSKLAPLTVLLQPVASGNGLAGLVGNGTWTAQLAANRSVYSKTNRPSQAGNNYTLAMAGSQSPLGFGSDPSTPCIFGFGTIAVDVAGNLSFRGALGDGTAVAERTFVSKQGWWPFYAPQRTGGGIAFGWLTFTNGANKDIDGFVTWVRPFSPGSKLYLYPAGFTNGMEVTGSRFQSGDVAQIFGSTTNCQVRLANGNLQSVTNYATLSANSVVTGSNRLSLSINGSSGSFKGSMVNSSEAQKPIALNGVLLTSLKAGVGAFLGTNQTGGILLLPGQ